MSLPIAAATRYVDAGVASSGDGTSWETAFVTIQEGIDAADEGDTIIIGRGVYLENIHFRSKNIFLRSADSLDPQVVTCTIIDGGGVGSVVTFAGDEGETCVLSGFTIRNGRSDFGGGICGGGWKRHTRARIQRNIIRTNEAGGQSSSHGDGGAVAYCDGVIEHNSIIANRSSISPTLSWTSQGGGLYQCNGTIEDNTIAYNSAGSGGGLCDCGGIIQNNVIMGNSATQEGGGLSRCDGVIQNNMIAGNSARRGGALADCDRAIQNNTIVQNSAVVAGGGLYRCFGGIRNCIIWANVEGQLHESTAPSHSCVQDWTGGGTGNVTEDPRFVDAGGPDDRPGTCQDNDYRLRATSACINAGADYYWFAWPQRDLDGNCRLAQGRTDMGCYEHGSFSDLDGDLLTDDDEISRHTNPLIADTDGDGLRDGLEILRGSDPCGTTHPRILYVPSAIPTVQASLCLAVTGEEIVVARGMYRENLHFCGADVILRSDDSAGFREILSATIGGVGTGPAVSFMGIESEACVLSGFAIVGGSGAEGGGVCGGTRDNRTCATIESNIIADNESPRHGGGLAYCDGILQNNIITGNRASYQAGGLYKCDGIIRNNVITRNSALLYGGGLAYCNGAIQNNVIFQNSGGSHGGGLARCAGTIRNCIVWENKSHDGEQLSDSSPPVFSCIQGRIRGGESNIAKDPQFVDADNDDFRLLPHSPCVDTGDNSALGLSQTDIRGMHRVMYGGKSLTVDMGAYEYYIMRLQPGPGAGQTTLTWSSLADRSYSIFYTDDLVTWHLAVDEFLSDGNTTTSWIDDGSTTGVPPSLAPQRFYRIQENP